MINEKKLNEKMLEEVLSLPVNLRIILIDKLIESLNLPIRKEIDEFWINEAEKRSYELDSGLIKPIPGEQAIQQIRNRFKHEIL